MNIDISFAYTSFIWSNNAKDNANVFCIIVGLKNASKEAKKCIFSNGQIISAKNISPYLINGNSVIVNSQSKSKYDVPEMSFGNMANDNGYLFLDYDEKTILENKYPEAKELIRQVMGSQEFIRGEKRYCLWITNKNLAIALSIPEIVMRIENCKKSRLESKREATNKLANTPWMFGEVRHKESDSIIIPRVSSERRKYFPIGFLSHNIIITDRAFAIYDAQMWVFGFLTSNFHMVWMRAVAGRLKMDYNYSSTLCYNTFPFPEISEEKKKEIEEAAEEVLCVRAEHSEKTLAEMYDPDKMPADLRAAHHNLDLIVESCYRKEPFTSDEERLEHLFKLYEKMTTK